VYSLEVYQDSRLVRLLKAKSTMGLVTVVTATVSRFANCTSKAGGDVRLKTRRVVRGDGGHLDCRTQRRQTIYRPRKMAKGNKTLAAVLCMAIFQQIGARAVY